MDAPHYTPDTVFDTFPWPQFPELAAPPQSIPSGLRPPAQGRTAGGPGGGGPTLGKRTKNPANPERVAPPSATSPFSLLPSTLDKIRSVASAAVSLRALRREIMKDNGWSLRDLYRSLETPGANRLRDAQTALDTAVRRAYGMKDTEDTLAFLLRLNLGLADLEVKGQPVTPPGFPPSVATSDELITPDCIQV